MPRNWFRYRERICVCMWLVCIWNCVIILVLFIFLGMRWKKISLRDFWWHRGTLNSVSFSSNPFTHTVTPLKRCNQPDNIDLMSTEPLKSAHWFWVYNIPVKFDLLISIKKVSLKGHFQWCYSKLESSSRMIDCTNRRLVSVLSIMIGKPRRLRWIAHCFT